MTGIDDHSRYCVIARTVLRAAARQVCQAFIEAMAVCGIPEEVLSDNGKVFTGRFHEPGVPAEVLFDRICRESAITRRLTRPRSPTATGKIERLHQTLQRELLEPRGPCESLQALQVGLDTWRPDTTASGRISRWRWPSRLPVHRHPGASPLALRVPAQLGGPEQSHPRPAQPAATRTRNHQSRHRL